MTTIAYRAGVLAADTRSIRGDTIDPHHAVKTFQSKDGRLFGLCGDMAEASSLARWIAKPKGERPVINDTTRVIEIKRGTATIHEGRGTFTYRIKKFNAWGSGCQAALVAMEYGASAKDAVRMAMKYDPGTGGRIRTLKERPK